MPCSLSQTYNLHLRRKCHPGTRGINRRFLPQQIECDFGVIHNHNGLAQYRDRADWTCEHVSNSSLALQQKGEWLDLGELTIGKFVL